MIKFKSISWQNFLSTGNETTVVQLDRSPTTLIVGQNGAGKSTMLDALSFSLFGKPHRDINKPQLVNTINNKNCVVEIEFDVGIHSFKIVRGIKPSKFEIYQNGNMINQSSMARDYQKFLEQNILKLNHKSFHQIVVLGSSSFIPFMQLPGGHRRDVIEDLLDINIFSKMNGILKERSARIKEDLKQMKLRQVGRGFIVSREDPLMGHRLTNGYVDQHDHLYVMENETYKRLSDCQRFLVVA